MNDCSVAAPQLGKQIQALTPEQIVTGLRRHIDPKKLVIVTAGDFQAKPARSSQ